MSFESTLQWSFSEFEVDYSDDGSCTHDQVYIFDRENNPQGPFCGFDAARVSVYMIVRNFILNRVNSFSDKNKKYSFINYNQKIIP